LWYSNIEKYFNLQPALLKKLLLILFVLYGFYGSSQTKAARPNSTNSGNPSQLGSKKYRAATTNSELDTLKHNICVNKQFSVVFYIVLDTLVTGPSPGLGFATPTNIAYMMSEVNEAFAPICVSFSTCGVYIIPNHNYGKSWTKSGIEPAVTAAYYTDQTINIYLVDSCFIGLGNLEPEGYTYMPTLANLATPKKDLLVIEKYKLLQLNGGVANHLMGHYFGLPHTHDEIAPIPAAVPPPPVVGIASQEFVDGSNCHVHGDGFCDTEADPGDNLFLVDGMGNYYMYPFDNFMSVYSSKNRFSQEQYNFMAYTILQKRMYLH